jgi:hypothetical protein
MNTLADIIIYIVPIAIAVTIFDRLGGAEWVLSLV